MSLLSALNIGSSALATQQAALQVTSNNIANVGNDDYTRQSASITSSQDQQIKPGVFVGTGIDLSAVSRQVDDALNERLRASLSDNNAASTTQDWLGRVQSVFNELSDSDLSTSLSTFFNSWSNLANNPADPGLRQVVLQNGSSLADFFKNVRSQIGSLTGDVSNQLGGLATQADSLTKQIATLNGQITTSEGATGGTASGLRDQRDAVLKQLSTLVNIHTAQDGSNVNVFIGSEPLVVGTTSRGIALKQTVSNGVASTSLAFKDNGGPIPATSGQLGSLVAVQSQISGVANQIDSIAGSLIFELNKVHSSGQGTEGYSSLVSSNAVSNANAPLDSAAANLPFTPNNGTFFVSVRDKTTGQITTTSVKVSLGASATTPTTLTSLASDLNAIPNLSATVAGGQLKLSTTNPYVDISFSQDSSGALAALGINNFFTGKNAQDIAVNSALTGNPSLLSASSNGKPDDNQVALAIAQLQTTPLKSLAGGTLTGAYESTVNGVAVSVSAAKTHASATQAVTDTLTAQRESISGVSLDEESINLLKQQRAYQGAARVISAVDQMLQTLLQIQ